jgi:hypothetical protein
MEPTFLLTHYLNDPLNTIKSLYSKYNIMSKNYNNMTILYNKYNTKHKTKLELECRSVIIDNTTNKIICYSCPTPIYNNDATNYIKRNENLMSSAQAYVCYEGSLLSIFYYNDNWYVSTRKCIYDNTSKKEEKYKMFLDVIESDGYTFETFTNTLDTSKSYHFVLIHHLNENIVDYKTEFGEGYTKLCFVSARDKNTMSECNIKDVRITFSPNIFIADRLDTFTNFDKYTDFDKYKDIDIPMYEGIIIKVDNNLLKIQNPSYQFYKAIGSDKNMLRGFLFLYQQNMLTTYFTNNPASEKFKKMINPLNTNETFDIIGIINCLFQVLTSELYELFNVLYSDGNKIPNIELYKYLPHEYKNILFKIRGAFMASKKKNVLSSENKEYISVKDILRILKTSDVNQIERLIKERKLLYNWSRLDKTVNSAIYINTLYKYEKIFYKLASIYTIKLFPEIMPTDVPQLNKS